MEKLAGYVEHIVYRNEENGYTVMNIVADGEEITCVGSFQAVSEGEGIEMEGEYTVHPPMVSAEGEQLSDQGAGGHGFHGALSGFRGDPGNRRGAGCPHCAQIPGGYFPYYRGRAGASGGSEGHQRAESPGDLGAGGGKTGTAPGYDVSAEYGVSLTLAVKIYHTYGMDTYRILQENPYKLAEDVEGIGFRIADEIAHRIGIHQDSDFRLRSGIIYVLQQAAQEGIHICRSPF